MGGNLNGSLLYRGLVFDFDECDSHGPLRSARFCGVLARPRDDLYLFGKPLVGWTRAEIAAIAEDHGVQLSDGPADDMSLTELALDLSFDNGRPCEVSWWQPGIRIVAVDSPPDRLGEPAVRHQGWPLGTQLRCARTGGRWEYRSDPSRQGGSGPYHGTLRWIDGDASLRGEDRGYGGDYLVMLGEPPWSG
jgi:hypothetical protein